MFDQRANEQQALRKWKVQLEQFERMLAQPNCNYALPHVRRLIDEKQHLQIKIAELEAKRAREDANPVPSKQSPEPAIQSALTADAPKGSLGSARPAAQPNEKLWKAIEITFLSDERIEICCGATERKTYNYGELGFEDRRNGKPNRAWTTLREMAKKDGTIPRLSAGKERAMVQKRIQEIRQSLRDYFRIDTDPIPFNGGVYQTSFKIGCKDCFDT